MEDSDHDRKGIENVIPRFLFFVFILYCWLTSLYFVDAHVLSPEHILPEETEEADEDAGSYSPELFHADENEEALDPEEDKAILVTFEPLFCCLCRIRRYYSLNK